MEDLSLTVRTYSASVASSPKPTVATYPASKSSGSESTTGKSSKAIKDEGASSDTLSTVPEEITVGAVKKAVDDLNSQLERSARSIRFQVDDSTNEIEVFVVDKETGDVVRKIPPEASIRLSANGELNGLLNIQG